MDLHNYLPETFNKAMPENTHSSNTGKFIPNLSQLQEAVDQLPNPEEWPEMSYISAVTTNGKEVPVRFKKRHVTRGSKNPFRWIYEGKVLIRKRDSHED
jgi:hypothetical protein